MTFSPNLQKYALARAEMVKMLNEHHKHQTSVNTEEIYPTNYRKIAKEITIILNKIKHCYKS